MRTLSNSDSTSNTVSFWRRYERDTVPMLAKRLDLVLGMATKRHSVQRDATSSKSIPMVAIRSTTRAVELILG
jgi:hypothetical protein